MKAIDWKYESANDSKNPYLLDISYNGKICGQWNNDANCDYPEDLVIGRDLNNLIDIGIKIGVEYASQLHHEQSEQKKDVWEWDKSLEKYKQYREDCLKSQTEILLYHDWLKQNCLLPSSRTVSEEEMERMAIDFANWLDKLTPSQKTSVWSKNGEHRGLFTMDNEQLFEKFKNKGLSLSSPKEEKEVADSLWIDVNEKMPESGQCVLLYSPKSGVGEGAWISAKGHFEQWRWNAIMTNVSHWMPLPSNPKATN